MTRMIDGGLRAGGWKVFCKTTGTVPMVIGVDGTARPLVRRGRANISEQVRVLHRAVREGAQILVIECMAVDPALQAVSQHRMVRADIGVITNVRLDHTAEMGPTLEEICDNPLEWDPVHGRRSVPGPASDQRTQKKLPGGAGPAGQRPAGLRFS